MEEIETLVAQMRETARLFPHDYNKNPLVDERCRSEINYKGHKIALVFSLDRIQGMTLWHLSVDPLESVIPNKAVLEIVRAFFVDGDIMELPQMFPGIPGMDKIRQFFTKE